MNFLDLLLLALALSVDSMVTLLILSFSHKKGRVVPVLVLISAVSLAHFLMMMLGSVLSLGVISYVGLYSEFVSAAIFAVLGINLFKDSMKDKMPSYSITLAKVAVLSYLLSVDALAAGFSLSITHNSFDRLTASLVVAIVVFNFSLACYLLAGRIKGNCSTWNTKFLLRFGAVLMFILAAKVFF